MFDKPTLWRGWNIQKLTEPNPKFNSVLLDDIIKGSSKYLKDEYDKTYVYNRDAIEFITTNFYNTTVKDTMNYLLSSKKMYLTKLEEFLMNIKYLKSMDWQFTCQTYEE